MAMHLRIPGVCTCFTPFPPSPVTSSYRAYLLNVSWVLLLMSIRNAVFLDQVTATSNQDNCPSLLTGHLWSSIHSFAKGTILKQYWITSTTLLLKILHHLLVKIDKLFNLALRLHPLASCPAQNLHSSHLHFFQLLSPRQAFTFFNLQAFKHIILAA